MLSIYVQLILFLLLSVDLTMLKVPPEGIHSMCPYNLAQNLVQSLWSNDLVRSSNSPLLTIDARFSIYHFHQGWKHNGTIVAWSPRALDAGTLRTLFISTWAPSQYPKRRLSVRSRKVSKPRDLYLELSDKHFGSSAVDVPVKFRSDTTI